MSLVTLDLVSLMSFVFSGTGLGAATMTVSFLEEKE
jgi:hypothetical protein